MIIGERIRLRGIERKDLELACRYMNDPDVILNLWTMIPYPMTMEKEEKWFEEQNKNNNIYNFAIETINESKYIGGCGINNLDWNNSTATVGIYIGDKNYRSKGYGTEAMKLLLDFIFNQINVNRVELYVFSFNERAIKSYKKNGFVEEGRLRQRLFRNGKFHDEIVMSVLREEYFKDKK
ncbi:acetyltransferase [Gottschalkia purinilytica]|uniref:Acetyltransferase n=1 Tax=Gottschalkia purinilytica TaxID=1503 RepID=A0A0L0WAA0_GOTPU|nr:GNAT family protein [Gottschalkia purinilytica]KNF08235.1 acetyltransferase [Gottschalkia purinilytica]